MEIKDAVVVVGAVGDHTDLALKLCQAIGFKAFRVFKKGEPGVVIASVEDDWVMEEGFDDLSESMFRLGLYAPAALYENGLIDCNHDRSMKEVFRALISWFVERCQFPENCPAGWEITRNVEDVFHRNFIPEVVSANSGWILSAGRIIVDFGMERVVVNLPEEYQPIFGMLQNVR